jgi:hypothetical protein
MTEVAWDPSDEAWTAWVVCPAYGTIRVIIQSDGEACPPTERQFAALRLIGALPRSVREELRRDVKRYATGYLPLDELEDLVEDDFDIAFDLALIPRLRDAKDTYFFMSGYSDGIDAEHGVAFLCRNGDRFCVCHTDFMYATYSYDDTAELERVLRSG